MGSYWSYFLERQVSPNWQLIPPRDGDEKSMPCLHWCRNHFALFSLFEYPGYFSDIHYDWPENASQELMPYRHSDAFWVPLDALCLRDWAHETLLLKGRVPAAVAPIFEQGQTPWDTLFPHLRESMPQTAWLLRSKGRYTPHPQTWYPHQLRKMNPERLVDVTWQETLENVAGAEFMTQIYHEGALPHVGETLRLVAIPE